MSKSIKVRGGLVLICLLLSLVSLAPTFFRNQLPQWWQKAFDPIHLGLDLQGGMHLVLGVDVDKAVESQLDSIIDQSETILRDQDVIFKRVDRKAGDRLAVIVYDEQSAAQVDALMAENFPTLEPMTLSTQGGDIEKNYRLGSSEVARIKKNAVDQAMETLRNRVDQFGVSEPTLQKSDNRILIQLPGIKDPKRAIALIGKTARLDFMMVAEDVDPQQALKGNLPPNTRLLYERRVNSRTGDVTEMPIVVQDKTVMTGDLLSDARVSIDPRYNEPYVSIDFNAVGAKRFDQITGANVGRRMAIVLDDTVYSAPVIRERISGGSAQISGSFSEQEAADLAIVLRAGALPAPVKVLEDRTVGPSLGFDSIQKGIISVLIGSAALLLAMGFYYRWSGAVANLALVLNLFFVLALLSLFKATLTLPGIGGLVLTLGMAVDANVLIFERIREELRLGKTARAALDAGYSKAFLTIIDANVTTLIAALVLFQFGTGPVKGFAVTLTIGIFSSLFTAIFVSRLVFDLFLARSQVKRLSI
jgi:preprotein translocase subunit SecD